MVVEVGGGSGWKWVAGVGGRSGWCKWVVGMGGWRGFIWEGRGKTALSDDWSSSIDDFVTLFPNANGVGKITKRILKQDRR